jgi:hypothetical protein
MVVLAVAGCCGGGTTHKCDFTPPNESGIDAGSDGPMLCGTQLCENGQVCCLTKAPPLANCIDPAKFQELHCEKMDLPCFRPPDCPMGLTCCLGLEDLTVSCRPQILCPGDGVKTVIACETIQDCPFNAPSCNLLTTVPDPKTGMDADFNVCGPAAAASEDLASTAQSALRSSAPHR